MYETEHSQCLYVNVGYFSKAFNDCFSYPSHWAHRWVWGSEHDSMRRLLLGLPGSRAAQQWRAHTHYLNSVWTQRPARAVAAAPCKTPQSLHDPDDHHRIDHTSGLQGIGMSLKKINNQTHTETHIKHSVLLFWECFKFPVEFSHLHNNNSTSCVYLHYKCSSLRRVSIENCKLRHDRQ